MSALDLTAAVEAAARAIFEEMWATAARPRPTWEDVAPPAKHHHRESVLPAVTAAAPLIEAAVREQIAREVLAARQKRGDTADLGRDYYERGVQFGMSDAARIARGTR